MTKKPQVRNRKKRQIYDGPLSEPGPSRFRFPLSDRLAPHTFFGSRSAEQIKEEVESEIRPDAENLLLLMDHYKISRQHKDRWRLLAFSLARDHVPAFRNPPIKGRPESDIDKMRVCCEVLGLSKEGTGKHSTARAIALVQQQRYPNVAPKTVAGWFYAYREQAQKNLREYDQEREREQSRDEATLMKK